MALSSGFWVLGLGFEFFFSRVEGHFRPEAPGLNQEGSCVAFPKSAQTL